MTQPYGQRTSVMVTLADIYALLEHSIANWGSLISRFSQLSSLSLKSLLGWERPEIMHTTKHIGNAPMPQQKPTLVTSQMWKLKLAFAGVLVSVGFMWFDEPLSRALEMQRYIHGAIGALMGVVTLLLTSLGVRCPSCRLSLVWFAVSTQSSSSWLHWLLDVRECPKCGHQASPYPQ